MVKKIVPDVVSNQKLICIEAGVSVCEAAQIMAENRIGALLVTKKDKLEGIITERDLLVKVVARAKDVKKTAVGDVMTKKPQCVNPDDLASDALEKMRKEGFRHLPVVDGHRIVGMVSIRDLYASAKDQLEDDLRERDEFIFGAGYGG